MNKLSHNSAIHLSLTSTEITVFDFVARNFTVLSIFQVKAPKISTKLQTGEVSAELGNNWKQHLATRYFFTTLCSNGEEIITQNFVI